VKRLGTSALILLFATALAAQQTSFPKVKVRFSRDKDLLVEKDADLMRAGRHGSCFFRETRN
jgi:hypothetical protein